jgi:hypothetical protein
MCMYGMYDVYVNGCVNKMAENHNIVLCLLLFRDSEVLCGTKAPTARAPAPRPPRPATPVFLRHFLLHAGWPAQPFDVGKRDVAVDGSQLGCSATCIKRWRSWRWRHLLSLPVGL